MSGNRLSSVTNAVRVLKAFTASHPRWGVSDLARHLDLSKSTVHRLLSTLTDEALIEQDPETGRYRLGLAMIDLAAAVPTQRELHEAALSPMSDLRSRTGETVQVGVLDGREVVYVERLDSPNTLRMFTELGRRAEAHCNGTGKVLLAFAAPDQRDRILDGWKPRARTEYTITNISKLREELRKIRSLGYAENRHESEVGVVSLAAPIRDRTRSTVAAISVAGPAERMDPIRNAIAQDVVETARSISVRLGFRAPSETTNPPPGAPL